ncbi:MAG: DUF4214 domain-containing protein [Clostridiales bacterium]|nr:DUF4214 domain-containing protein [Clostridiales bacterium]
MKLRSKLTTVFAVVLSVVLVPIAASKIHLEDVSEVSGVLSVRQQACSRAVEQNLGREPEATVTPPVSPTPTPEGMPINDSNFPDAMFREYVFRYDANRNGYLTEDEIATITDILCPKKGITNLSGIQYFSNLRNLVVNDNAITSVELRYNTNLEILYINNNNLQSLDISHNPKLRMLVCFNNQLPSLDVCQNTKLESLDCSTNRIKYIDVSKCANLCNLKVEGNQLTYLDISRVPLIKQTYETGTRSEANGKVYYHMSANNKIYMFNVDASVRVSSDGTGSPFPTPSDPTPSPNDPSFGDFVERLYKVALGRDSEPEGKAFWINKVVKEGATGAECARYFLLTAPEFMNRKLPNEEFLETLYHTFFDRESDEVGKAFWLDQMTKGTPKKDVVNAFIESEEWCDICATYGVKSGAVAHKAKIVSKNAKAFATRLYTCCLGRAPEEGGLQYWGLALTNLEKSGFAAAYQFFHSEEFNNYRFSDGEYIRRLYTTFMGREPEVNGFNFWLNALANGTDRDTVLVEFAKSTEFGNICLTYGIDRGV